LSIFIQNKKAFPQNSLFHLPIAYPTKKTGMQTAKKRGDALSTKYIQKQKF